MDLGASVRKLTLGTIAIVQLLDGRRSSSLCRAICRQTKHRHAHDRRRWDGVISAPMVGAQASAIRPRTSIASPGRGAVFTSWYGQASCTAGRASFMTGRIPIRSAFRSWSFRLTRTASQRHADDCRILPEERLHHLLLRQMASRGSAQVLSHPTRLRRDEAIRCLLSGRLYLRRHELPTHIPAVPKI